MKLQFLIILLLCLNFQDYSGQNDLLKIREKFHHESSEENLQYIISYEVADDSEDSNTIKAYKGASTAMMAEYAFWPMAKLTYFEQGKLLLEYSISSEQNLENTYLRLLLQINSPKILSYNCNIEEDHEYFVKNFKSSDIDEHSKRDFLNALLSNDCSDFDTSSIESLKMK